MAVTINTGGTYSVTRVDTADSATNWAATTLEGSGGGAGLLASVGTIDLVAEGTDARASRTNKQRVLLAFTNSAGYDFTSGSSGTGATAVPNGNAYIWAAFLAAGSAFLKANGGLQIMLGDGTNRSFWNVAGSDTYSGGFKKWAVNTGVTESENDGATATLGDITEIGFVTDVGGTTTRFDNFVVDAMEVGDGLTFQGTTASDAMFSESQVVDGATAIGVLSNSNGIIFSQGSVEFSGTAMTSIGETMVFTDTLGGAYTYQFDVSGTVTMTNSIVNSSGAVDFNFDTSGATAFTMTGGSLGGFNTLTTAAAQTMSGIVFQSGGVSTVANTISDSSFNLCGLITLTGAFDGCTINESTATSAVTTADLDKITSTTFVSDGTGHAVTITTAGTYDWDANKESGYGATGTTNATVYNNSGGSVTINVINGGSTPTYLNGAAASTTIVAGSVTVQANAALKDGTPVENARVYLRASDGTGPFPYLDSVTITRSTTTATVAHTSHGMATNDKIVLAGISDKTTDNGIHQITVTTANAYTYTTTDSGSTSYTGTITSTFVALSGLTGVGGDLSVSRVYPSNQPVTGWTRKSTSSPFLQEGVLVGTISSSTGFNGTAVMLSDE
jgi:hypothetical protein